MFACSILIFYNIAGSCKVLIDDEVSNYLNTSLHSLSHQVALIDWAICITKIFYVNKTLTINDSYEYTAYSCDLYMARTTGV